MVVGNRLNVHYTNMALRKIKRYMYIHSRLELILLRTSIPKNK